MYQNPSPGASAVSSVCEPASVIVATRLSPSAWRSADSRSRPAGTSPGASSMNPPGPAEQRLDTGSNPDATLAGGCVPSVVVVDSVVVVASSALLQDATVRTRDNNGEGRPDLTVHPTEGTDRQCEPDALPEPSLACTDRRNRSRHRSCDLRCDIAPSPHREPLPALPAILAHLLTQHHETPPWRFVRPARIGTTHPQTGLCVGSESGRHTSRGRELSSSRRRRHSTPARSLTFRPPIRNTEETSR